MASFRSMASLSTVTLVETILMWFSAAVIACLCCVHIYKSINEHMNKVVNKVFQLSISVNFILSIISLTLIPISFLVTEYRDFELIWLFVFIALWGAKSAQYASLLWKVKLVFNDTIHAVRRYRVESLFIIGILGSGSVCFIWIWHYMPFSAGHSAFVLSDGAGFSLNAPFQYGIGYMIVDVVIQVASVYMYATRLKALMEDQGNYWNERTSMIRAVLIKALILQISPIAIASLSFVLYCASGFVAMWVIDTLWQVIVMLLNLASYQRWYSKLCVPCQICCQNAFVLPEQEMDVEEQDDSGGPPTCTTLQAGTSAHSTAGSLEAELSRQKSPIHRRTDNKQVLKNLAQVGFGEYEDSFTAMNEGSLDRIPIPYNAGGTELYIIDPDPAADSEEKDDFKNVKAPTEDEKEVVLPPERRERFRVNDVVLDEHNGSGEQYGNVHEFGFGVYLEYWKKKSKNRVHPNHKTLREELTKNIHATTSEDQYDELEKKCTLILDRNLFIAKNIGTMNRVCGIRAGTAMSIEHAICMKLYTDFDHVQREFKKHCRRKYQDEPMQDLMKRNAEIAHWCRRLRECVMFFGDPIGPKQLVYSGMNARLMFTSLYQRFECPLSTTVSKSVADQFTEYHKGMRLTLKRANPKSRFFDVAPFSIYEHEKERLVLGSTLKIVNIHLGLRSFKWHVAALLMLEQIIKGRFIDGKEKARNFLLKFLMKMTSALVMDCVMEDDPVSDLTDFLDEELYDTDAVLFDIDDIEQAVGTADGVHDSRNIGNISNVLGDSFAAERVAKLIKKRNETLKNLLDEEGEENYFWMLFVNFLGEMKSMMESGDLWINRKEIDKPEMSKIRDILFGDEFTDIPGMIALDEVNWVQEYQWWIGCDDYQSMLNLQLSDFIESPIYRYSLDEENDIAFRFRMYGQHSEDILRCAIYLEMMGMPEQVKRLRIEVDIKCLKMKDFEGTVFFRHWLKPQIISKVGDTRGFQCFEREEIEGKESLQWVFGVKVFKVEMKESENFVEA